MFTKNEFDDFFQIEVSLSLEDKYLKALERQLNKIMTSAKSHLDTALPELIRELGYTFTSNVEQCKNNLKQLVGGPDIYAATVARIIGVMVRTHTGLDDPATLQVNILFAQIKSNSVLDGVNFNFRI